MKLKYQFVIRAMGGKFVAVASGDDSALFNGMVKLNKTGAFIFEQLMEETTVEEIAEKFIQKYDVNKEQAIRDITQCVGNFQAHGILEN